MTEVTLGLDELEANDLPRVCLVCGSRRDVAFVRRRFMWRPLFAPPGLILMLTTKRATAEVPLCPEHGGPRLFAHQRFTWWGLKTVAIGADRLTLGRVHDDFAAALRRWRERRWDDGRDPEPRGARIRVGRGQGAGMTALKVLGVLAAVMAVLVVVMVLGMFVVMGMSMWWLTVARPVVPPGPPAPPAVAAAEPAPENVVVGLLGVAADAGGPGGLPWGPLALAGRRETFHLLPDAEIDRALADLKSRNPSVVATAARRLAQARPSPDRRAETARALLGAMANPFPSTREAAAAALGVWGAADDVPALTAMLADPDPNTRSAAMTALVGLKDERGAAAVAGQLSDFLDRPKAARALVAMGPLAEKAVMPLAGQGDSQTRIAACGVLAAVGTPASLPALETAARDPDINVARAAADAVQAIKGRR